MRIKANKKSITIDTSKMIKIWSEMIVNNEQYTKRSGSYKPFPRFTLDEADFLTDLIFHKQYKYLVIEVADAIADLYFWADSSLNGRDARRIRFLQHYILEGNAARAAIRAGYSPKAAKQQGYRTLKWIQSRMKQERGKSLSA